MPGYVASAGYNPATNLTTVTHLKPEPLRKGFVCGAIMFLELLFGVVFVKAVSGRLASEGHVVYQFMFPEVD